MSRCRREKRSAFIYLARKQRLNRNLLHIARRGAKFRGASNSISSYSIQRERVLANSGPLFACRIARALDSILFSFVFSHGEKS
jgi:hypothetical protein